MRYFETWGFNLTSSLISSTNLVESKVPGRHKLLGQPQCSWGETYMVSQGYREALKSLMLPYKASRTSHTPAKARWLADYVFKSLCKLLGISPSPPDGLNLHKKNNE